LYKYKTCAIICSRIANFYGWASVNMEMWGAFSSKHKWKWRNVFQNMFVSIVVG